MSYIDKLHGIKSAKGIEKYITKITGVEVMVIKVADYIRVIWAVENKLQHHDIKGSVIYVIKDEALTNAINSVMESFKPKTNLSPDSMKEFLEKMGMNEEWEIISNPDIILNRIDVDKLSPFNSRVSLHIIEDRYLIDNDTYRVISTIGSNNEDVEKLIVK